MKHIILASLGLTALTLFIVDIALSEPHVFYGTVIDKHYSAERNSTGIGTASNGNGSSSTVIVSEHEDEKFLLIVKTTVGTIETVECEPELYYHKEKNSSIKCYAYKGYFTKCVWSLKGIH